MAGSHADHVDTQLASYIGGVWVDGAAEAIESRNPATEARVATFRSCDAGQIAEAVSAARTAAASWAQTPAGERARLLRRLADLIEDDTARLADLVVAEVGSPLSLALELQVGQPIKNFRWFADAAIRGPVGGYRQPLPTIYGDKPSESVLVREPVGVVAAIVPYNYPLNMISWKAGPALASGCTVVVLPSPQGSACAIAFAKLTEAAGFPPGVINVVLGGASAGQELVASPDVDMVSFTGSNNVGAKVMAAAAQNSTKVVLELGGKSPNLILPGADLSEVVPSSILRFCRNAGQGCGATTRILVHDEDYPEFVERAQKFIAEHVKVGDPRSLDTTVGPLISQAHRANVEGYLARCVEAGGTILAGGGRPIGNPVGYFLEPTLVGGVDADAEISQNELFAPVANVLTYSSIDEAVSIANSTRFGLNAVVWGDLDEALAVAGRIESGTVAVNGGGPMRSDVPWGGFKQSGIGSEMGEDGFREFFRVKHISWPAP
jgi:aldehyde dehydrogenase (NAD+)